jgi:hypothetical protein
MAQTSFYKKLLHLPFSTPGYVVRMETGSTHLGFDILMLALRFVRRILSREKDSYLVECLKWQVRNSRNDEGFRCWGNTLRKHIREATGHDIFGHSFDSLEEVLALEMRQILGKLKRHFLNTDCANLVKSQWAKSYAEAKTHIGVEWYLKCNKLPLWTAQVVAQMRVRILNIKLNGTKVSVSGNSQCVWCKDSVNSDNLEHYIFSCTILTSERKLISKFFGNCTRFTELFKRNAKDSDFLKNLFVFWKRSCEKL